ncbi:PH domain-containing protein [Lentilactobacillus kefiri]|uniref:PH domain-containing protein n=1 Tax=Lentilactobacillus kefiri TaxID=33962 RepID=UPI00345EDD15
MTSNKPQHLNPLAILYFIFGHSWDAIFLIIISSGPIAHFSRYIGIAPLLGFAGLIVLIVLWHTVRYLYFTFEIDDKMLTINSGILVKKHTHIPYPKIQTIQHTQWFFLVPFHLEKLQIETAGHDSTSPEAVLPLVNERIREEIERKRMGDSGVAADQAEATPEQKQSTDDAANYEIDPHELNVFALTSLGVFPIIGALLAIYGKAQEAIPEKFINSVTNVIIHQSAIIIGIVGILIIILSIAGSYLLIITRYYKFRLHSSNNQLKTEQGMFQRNSVTIPTARIQALQIKQNVIRQWCHISTVQAVTASSAGDDEDDNDLMILPVVKNNQVFKTLTPFVNWAPKQFSQLESLNKRTYWYFIRNAALLSLIVILPCLYFFHLWGSLSLLMLPIAILMGWYAGANTGWKIIDGQLILQNGHFFSRSQYVIPHKNIQSFSFAQSIWMTHTKLAHIRVNIRHGDTNQEIEIRYLPEKTGKEIFNWLKIR